MPVNCYSDFLLVRFLEYQHQHVIDFGNNMAITVAATITNTVILNLITDVESCEQTLETEVEMFYL